MEKELWSLTCRRVKSGYSTRFFCCVYASSEEEAKEIFDETLGNKATLLHIERNHRPELPICICGGVKIRTGDW